MYLDIDQNKAYAYTAAQPFDPAKRSVVFIHGAEHDHSVWNLQSRYCAYHGWNVLAVDLPAHGRSEGPPLSDVEAMAGWLIKFLDAAATSKVALVGHSMGSLIALEAASHLGERVSHLALLGAAYPMLVSDQLLNAARDDEREARQMVNIWSHSPAMQMGGNPNPGMWMLGRNQRLMERMAPGVFYTDLAACNGYRGGERAARAIPCPTLLLLGERDMMTSAKSGRALGQMIRGARTAVIARCGHAMMAEKPDEVLDVLIDFLA
jgi:pimeloyl-ACP methyl ester carboxylesterase